MAIIYVCGRCGGEGKATNSCRSDWGYGQEVEVRMECNGVKSGRPHYPVWWSYSVKQGLDHEYNPHGAYQIKTIIEGEEQRI